MSSLTNKDIEIGCHYRFEDIGDSFDGLRVIVVSKSNFYIHVTPMPGHETLYALYVKNYTADGIAPDDLEPISALEQLAEILTE